MTIGIMGGTFDPVHNGHLQIAEAAMEQLHLDRVLWIPTGLPPHKKTAVSDEDRLTMLRLALDGRDGHVLDLCEMNRKGYTRTVDTLRELHQRLPDAEFVFLIGADTVLQLRNWKDFATVATLCSFGILRRRPNVDDASADEPERLKEEFDLRYETIDLPLIPISSSDVRKDVAAGRDVSEKIPEAVYRYIQNHSLYKELVE